MNFNGNVVLGARPAKKSGIILGDDGKVTPMAWGVFGLLLAGAIGYGIRAVVSK